MWGLWRVEGRLQVAVDALTHNPGPKQGPPEGRAKPRRPTLAQAPPAPAALRSGHRAPIRHRCGSLAPSRLRGVAAPT
eukprot:3724167-Prymnesium_polylepis.2